MPKIKRLNSSRKPKLGGWGEVMWVIWKVVIGAGRQLRRRWFF
jgi:hypothetical protein